LDLAVANYDDNSVTILLGKGDGTFMPPSSSPVSVGAGPTALAMGDFTGDGKLDLAVANSTDNTLTILLGPGDGTFTPVSSPPATGTPFGLAIGDFNGDGKLDLAVANFDFNTVTILLGSGDGTFAPASSPPATAGPALVVGDFNGDGKLDLAVTNRGNSALTILLGNGDGTFAPITGCCGTSVELTHTLGMAAGDFNGDGKLDLAVAILNIQPMFPVDYVIILLGKGDGTLAPTDFSLLLPDQPASLVAGDFDGDGKLDFATASDPNNYVSVLLQIPPSGPGPDFAIAASPTSLSVQPGGTAKGTLQVSSLSGFLGAVSLSCFRRTQPRDVFRHAVLSLRVRHGDRYSQPERYDHGTIGAIADSGKRARGSATKPLAVGSMGITVGNDVRCDADPHSGEVCPCLGAGTAGGGSGLPRVSDRLRRR